MQIHARSEGDLLELTVTGVLDNESSVHFRKSIDDHVRDGWHRILVHMQGVSYISSAGIGALVSAKKRLAQLEGLFGICGLTPEVERVLSLVRVLDGLRCDPQQARASVSVGDYTRSLSVRIARADGLDLEVYTLEGNHSLACRVMGDPRPIFESTFTEQNCRSVEFPEQSFALGLGALGGDFGSACPRFGEFLAVAGAVTHSAQSRRGLPDYSQSQGEFIPRTHVLYGIQCEGGFSHLIRFHPVEADEPVGLSAIVAQCLRQSACSLAGVVLLAESAGLLGVHLCRSPAAASVSAVERFRFPELRDWLSYSPERVYSRHLALMVGVVQTGGTDLSSPSLDAMLRPLDADGELRGHFHAAVFPYHPLKKRTLDLYASVRVLFQSGSIQDVLHLVRDDRPVVGAGESELLGGACWVSPIRDIVAGERNR